MSATPLLGPDRSSSPHVNKNKLCINNIVAETIASVMLLAVAGVLLREPRRVDDRQTAKVASPGGHDLREQQ